MSKPISLTGMTWNHTRGFVPVVATAQRFMDEHPHVSIVWQKRSLKDFGDFPLEKLVEHFDLLVIDHPFAGYAASHPVLAPLDQHLPANYLADQTANSVGASYSSYLYGGHLWALPIDAATPVSGYRPDLLARHDAAIPTAWDELLTLAARGLVTAPAAPTDAMMHFVMLCLAVSPQEPFQSAGEMTDHETGVAALEMLHELVSLCDPACLTRNPIRTWEALSRGDDLLYCPFAYGYANYGRRDYTEHPLRFGGLVSLHGKPLRSVLGGAGLAVSSRVTDPETLDVALRYAAFSCDPNTQRGLYATSGGQPGHRQAWLDQDLNVLCNNFFIDTLPTLDAAWLRPRYAGYNRFQDQAGEVVHGYLRDGGNPVIAFERIQSLYRESHVDG